MFESIVNAYENINNTKEALTDKAYDAFVGNARKEINKRYKPRKVEAKKVTKSGNDCVITIRTQYITYLLAAMNVNLAKENDYEKLSENTLGKFPLYSAFEKAASIAKFGYEVQDELPSLPTDIESYIEKSSEKLEEFISEKCIEKNEPSKLVDQRNNGSYKWVNPWFGFRYIKEFLWEGDLRALTTTDPIYNVDGLKSHAKVFQKMSLSDPEPLDSEELWKGYVIRGVVTRTEDVEYALGTGERNQYGVNSSYTTKPISKAFTGELVFVYSRYPVTGSGASYSIDYSYVSTNNFSDLFVYTNATELENALYKGYTKDLLTGAIIYDNTNSVNINPNFINLDSHMRMGLSSNVDGTWGGNGYVQNPDTNYFTYNTAFQKANYAFNGDYTGQGTYGWITDTLSFNIQWVFVNRNQMENYRYLMELLTKYKGNRGGLGTERYYNQRRYYDYYETTLIYNSDYYCYNIADNLLYQYERREDKSELPNINFIDYMQIYNYHLAGLLKSRMTTYSYFGTGWLDSNRSGSQYLDGATYTSKYFEKTYTIFEYGDPPKMADSCCLETKALLKMLLKKTDKLLENVGDFPAVVPDNIAAEKPANIQVDSLGELVLWLSKQLDGIAGNYPIEIEVEDNDLTKKGNQTVKLKLPNQAEAMAEMIGLLLTLKMESSATLSAAVKGMIEAGGAKQAAVVASDLSLANAEYLGYKLNKVKKDIGMSFTPGKQKLDEVLEPVTANYIGYENTDDKDIKDVIHPLLEMASRWNAQNYRHIGKGDNATDKLLGLLSFQPNSTGDAVTKDKDTEDDFDDWLESAEIGFSDKAKTDKEKPFGDDRDARPKLVNKSKKTGGQ